jgi:hypothetical protein
VADIGALHPEDHILGDVGGVVGDSFQVARYEERVKSLANHIRALIHRLYQLDEGIVLHAIDHVIHLKYGLRELGFAFDESFERPANHGAHGCAHASNIDWQIGGRKFSHVHNTLSDVYGLVADAFEIGINFGYGKDEAQIDSHGLLHGKEIESRLVDFPLRRVDQALAFKNHLAAGEVTINVRLSRTIHRLLRQSTHAEQLLAQIVEALLKARAHYPTFLILIRTLLSRRSDKRFYPNRPVM